MPLLPLPLDGQSLPFHGLPLPLDALALPLDGSHSTVDGSLRPTLAAPPAPRLWRLSSLLCPPSLVPSLSCAHLSASPLSRILHAVIRRPLQTPRRPSPTRGRAARAQHARCFVSTSPTWTIAAWATTRLERGDVSVRAPLPIERDAVLARGRGSARLGGQLLRRQWAAELVRAVPLGVLQPGGTTLRCVCIGRVVRWWSEERGSGQRDVRDGESWGQAV